ncbi:hypothetical protein ACFL6D_02555 [Spirochaetota bacterium]
MKACKIIVSMSIILFFSLSILLIAESPDFTIETMTYNEDQWDNPAYPFGEIQSNFSPDSEGSNQLMVFVVRMTNTNFNEVTEYRLIIDIDGDGIFDTNEDGNDWYRSGGFGSGIQTNFYGWNGHHKNISGDTVEPNKAYIVSNGIYTVQIQLDDQNMGTNVVTNEVLVEINTSFLWGTMTISNSGGYAQVSCENENNRVYSKPVTNGEIYRIYGFDQTAYEMGWLTSRVIDLPGVSGKMLGYDWHDTTDLSTGSNTNAVDIVMTDEDAVSIFGYVIDYMTGEPAGDMRIDFKPRDDDNYLSENTKSSYDGSYSNIIRGGTSYEYQVYPYNSGDTRYGRLGGMIDIGLSSVNRKFYVGPAGVIKVTLNPTMGGICMDANDAVTGVSVHHVDTDSGGSSAFTVGGGMIEIRSDSFSNTNNGLYYGEGSTNVSILDGEFMAITLNLDQAYRVWGNVTTNSEAFANGDVSIKEKDSDDWGDDTSIDSNGIYDFNQKNNYFLPGEYTIALRPKQGSGMAGITTNITIVNSDLQVDIETYPPTNFITVGFSNWTDYTNTGASIVAYAIRWGVDLVENDEGEAMGIISNDTTDYCQIAVKYAQSNYDVAIFQIWNMQEPQNMVMITGVVSNKAGETNWATDDPTSNWLTGTLTNDDTGEPMSGLNVVVTDDDKHFVYMTGMSDGNWVLTNIIRPGPYNLTFVSFGGGFQPVVFSNLAGETHTNLRFSSSMAQGPDEVPPSIRYLTPSDDGMATNSIIRFYLDDNGGVGVDTNSISVSWISPALGSYSISDTELTWSNGWVTVDIGPLTDTNTIEISAADYSNNVNTKQTTFWIDSTPIDITNTAIIDNNGTRDHVIGEGELGADLYIEWEGNESGNYTIFIDVDNNSVFDAASDFYLRNWQNGEPAAHNLSFSNTNRIPIKVSGSIDLRDAWGENSTYYDLPEGYLPIIALIDDSYSHSALDGNTLQLTVPFYKDTSAPVVTNARVISSNELEVAFDENSFIIDISACITSNWTITSESTNYSQNVVTFEFSPAVGLSDSNTFFIDISNVVDRGDNSSSSNEIPVTIEDNDDTAPDALSIDFPPADVWQTGPITIRGSAGDSNGEIGSGAIYTNIAVNPLPGFGFTNAPALGGTRYFTNYLDTAILPTGTNTLWVIDENIGVQVEAATNSFTVLADNTPPVLTNSNYSVLPESISFTLGASDEGAGILEYLITNETTGGPAIDIDSNTYTLNGLQELTSYQIKIAVYDYVGLSSGFYTFDILTPAKIWELKTDSDGDVKVSSPPDGISTNVFTPDDNRDNDAIVFCFKITNADWVNGDYELIIDIDSDGIYESTDWKTTGACEGLSNWTYVQWGGQNRYVDYNNWYDNHGGNPNTNEPYIVSNAVYSARVIIDTNKNDTVENAKFTNTWTVTPESGMIYGTLTFSESTELGWLTIDENQNNANSMSVYNGDPYYIAGLNIQNKMWADRLQFYNQDYPAVDMRELLGDVELSFPSSGSTNINLVVSNIQKVTMTGIVQDYITSEVIPQANIEFRPQDWSYGSEHTETDGSGVYLDVLRANTSYSYHITSSAGAGYGAFSTGADGTVQTNNFKIGAGSSLSVEVNNAFADVEVEVKDENYNNIGGTFKTLSDGIAERENPLPAGNYKVWISGFSNTNTGVNYTFVRTNITAIDGGDVYLTIDPPLGYRIYGTVKTNGIIYDKAKVEVYYSNDNIRIAEDDTDSNGNYNFNSDSSWKTYFSDGSYDVLAKDEYEVDTRLFQTESNVTISGADAQVDFNLIYMTNVITVIYSNYASSPGNILMFGFKSGMSLNNALKGSPAYMATINKLTNYMYVESDSDTYAFSLVEFDMNTQIPGQAYMVTNNVSVGDVIYFDHVPIGTNILTGNVLNAVTGDPLQSYVGIYKQGTSNIISGDFSDAYGAFSATNIPEEGPYYLEVVPMGGSTGINYFGTFSNVPSGISTNLLIFVDDNTPPVIQYIYPVPKGSTTNGSIKFFTHDGSGWGVDTNLIAITWLGGDGPSFGTNTVGNGITYTDGWVEMTNDTWNGSNDIRITIADKSANSNTIAYTMWVDKVPPVITALSLSNVSTGDAYVGPNEYNTPFWYTIDLGAPDSGSYSLFLDSDHDDAFNPNLDWYAVDNSNTEAVKRVTYTNKQTITNYLQNFDFIEADETPHLFSELSDGEYSLVLRLDDTLTPTVGDGNLIITNLTFIKDTSQPQLISASALDTNRVELVFDTNCMIWNLECAFISNWTILTQEVASNTAVLTVDKEISADNDTGKMILDLSNVTDMGSNVLVSNGIVVDIVDGDTSPPLLSSITYPVAQWVSGVIILEGQTVDNKIVGHVEIYSNLATLPLSGFGFATTATNGAIRDFTNQIDTADYPDGSNPFWIVAYNDSIDPESKTNSFSLNIDNTPPSTPTVDFTSLSSGFIFEMSANDATSGVKSFLITNITESLRPMYEETSPYTYTNLDVDTTFTFSFWAKDNAGNISTTSYDNFFKTSNDITPPEIIFYANGATNLDADEWYNSDDELQFEITEPEGYQAAQLLVIDLTDSNLIVVDQPANIYTLDVSGISDGIHNFKLVVTNMVPLTNTNAVNIRIDNTAPVVDIESGEVVFDPDLRAEFTWPAGSDGSGSGIASYVIRIDEEDETNVSTNLGYTTAEPLTFEEHTWQLMAIDVAGNEGSWSAEATAYPTNVLPPEDIRDKVKDGKFIMHSSVADGDVPALRIYGKYKTGEKVKIQVLDILNNIIWECEKEVTHSEGDFYVFFEMANEDGDSPPPGQYVMHIISQNGKMRLPIIIK